MRRFLNFQSFRKVGFRSIQVSIVALIMLLGLNLGTMKSAIAAPTSEVKSFPVAIFGLGRQAEGNVDQAVGKAQESLGRVTDKTKGFATQAKGRAESDIGRIESSAKSKTQDALSNAANSVSDTANMAVDKVKDMIMTPSSPVQGSDPTKGTAQMPESMKAAEDVANSPPMSMKEVEERSKEGINEVQGGADKDRMYKSNTNQPGPAIVKGLEKAVDKAKN